MTFYLALLPTLGLAGGAGFVGMCYRGIDRRDQLVAILIGGTSGAVTGVLLLLAAWLVLV